MGLPCEPIWSSTRTWTGTTSRGSAEQVPGLPIVVKGLLTAEDAELAVQAGADGIVVSNHGGRQLDSSPSGLGALPEVAAQVAGRIPVLMDGGVRRGTDVLKAMALGAERRPRRSSHRLGSRRRRPRRRRRRAGHPARGVRERHGAHRLPLGRRDRSVVDRAGALAVVGARRCDAPRTRLPPLRDDERLRPPHPQFLLATARTPPPRTSPWRWSAACRASPSPTTTPPKGSTRRRGRRGGHRPGDRAGDRVLRRVRRGEPARARRTGSTPRTRRLRDELQRLTDTRFRRGEMMVEKLQELGYDISFERVREIADDGADRPAARRQGHGRGRHRAHREGSVRPVHQRRRHRLRPQARARPDRFARPDRGRRRHLRAGPPRDVEGRGFRARRADRADGRRRHGRPGGRPPRPRRDAARLLPRAWPAARPGAHRRQRLPRGALRLPLGCETTDAERFAELQRRAGR